MVAESLFTADEESTTSPYESADHRTDFMSSGSSHDFSAASTSVSPRWITQQQATTALHTTTVHPSTTTTKEAPSSLDNSASTVHAIEPTRHER
ncbi:hypothetical protein Q1695_000732 [Nippostrongylus brasiliensis]|nr:hypothetical protein Q1695_000732 [Nippostrongylus brasiliensis]